MPLCRLFVALLAAVLAARAAAPSVTYPAGPSPGAAEHLVFLTDDKEYRGKVPGIDDPAMATPWTRLNGLPDSKTTRVFCTTPGAATDLANEGLRRLVVNAVLRDFALEIPAAADVRYVDPYSPTRYAFKGCRRGLTPADHAPGQALPLGTGKP